MPVTSRVFRSALGPVDQFVLMVMSIPQYVQLAMHRHTPCIHVCAPMVVVVVGWVHAATSDACALVNSVLPLRRR